MNESGLRRPAGYDDAKDEGQRMHAGAMDRILTGNWLKPDHRQRRAGAEKALIGARKRARARLLPYSPAAASPVSRTERTTLPLR